MRSRVVGGIGSNKLETVKEFKKENLVIKMEEGKQLSSGVHRTYS